MNIFYLFMLLISLLVLVIQDFKQRAVSWIPLLGVFIFGSLYSLDTLSFQSLLKNMFFNALFIGIQLLVITFYFSLKAKRPVNIINTYLGIGDILFFIAIAGLFSTLNFIVYYTTAITLLLVLYSISHFIKNNKQSIPLAGGLALILIVLLSGNFFITDINILDDFTILAYL